MLVTTVSGPRPGLYTTTVYSSVAGATANFTVTWFLSVRVKVALASAPLLLYMT